MSVTHHAPLAKHALTTDTDEVGAPNNRRVYLASFYFSATGGGPIQLWPANNCMRKTHDGRRRHSKVKRV